MGAATVWWNTGAAALILGLALAAAWDLREREVPDGLWQALGVLGLAGGAVVLSYAGPFPVVVWIVVGALALEHMFQWDANSDGPLARWADVLELVFYALVTAFVGVSVLRWGVGGSGVPAVAVALLVTIIVARVLFEAGVLYGGADAKALIIAGVLVPLFPTPWLTLPAHAQSFATFVPFAVNLLMDAALLSVVIPIAVAVRNARRHEFDVRTGFTTYTIPVAELPQRYVWVRDPARPTTPEEEEAIETSEQDRAWRVKVADELRARGIDRVRVGPQLPFIVLMLGGALGALLLGNWIIDLLALL